MTNPAVGQLIGNRYQLKRSLSTGGMGQVYEAIDTHLFNRRVAIKILHQNLSGNEKLRRRFNNEIRISSFLGEHPLIVRVMDYGFHQDQPYIVMEYLGGAPFAGQPLNVVLKRGPIPVRRVVRLGRQICSALQYAHSFSANQPDFKINGVIHRDIKPSNIFILQDQTMGETTKVLDFGIAKMLTDVTMAMGTQMGFIGTPAYASPEQMRGEQLNFRADIYSLGIVLYEMLTGKLPLTPETDSFAGWYQAQNHQDPHPFNPRKIPPAIATVVMACLSKDRDKRPASMGDLREQLKAALQESIAFINQSAPAPSPAASQDAKLARQAGKSKDPTRNVKRSKPKSPPQDAQFLQLIRPLELILAPFNVAPRFKVRKQELHILLSYPKDASIDRPSIIKHISDNLQERKDTLQIERSIIYGRPFRQDRPDWKEIISLYELDTDSLALLNQAQFTPDPEPIEEEVLQDLVQAEDHLAGSVNADLLDPDLMDPDLAELSEADEDQDGDSKSTADIEAYLRQSLTSDHKHRLTQFGQLSQPIFLAGLPDLSDRLTRLKTWSSDKSGFILNTIFFIEMHRSILDIDPSALVDYQEGVASLRDNQLDQAIQQLSSALSVDPSMAEAHVYRGQAYARQGDLIRATSDLRTALSLNPSMAEAHAYLGSIYVQQGQRDEAIESFRSALDLDPALTETYPTFLKALVHKGYINEAIQYYLDALEKVPQLISLRTQMAEVMLIYARSLLVEGKQTDAIQYLKKAVSFDSNDAMLHCYLGLATVVGSTKSDWQEAMTEFRIALQLQPRLRGPQLGLALAYSKHENFKAALKAYQSAIAEDPEQPTAYYYLGLVYYRQGELATAIQSFRTVLKYMPRSVEGNTALGDCLLQSGDCDAAQQALDQALRLGGPHLPKTYCSKGNLYIYLEHFNSAVTSFQQALDLSSDLASAHAGMGLAYLFQGHTFTPDPSVTITDPSALEAAQSKLDLALQLDPLLPEAWYGLGTLKLIHLETKAAIQCFRIALQSNLSYTAAHFKLGVALQQNGQIEEAMGSIRIALQLNSNYPQAQSVLNHLVTR